MFCRTGRGAGGGALLGLEVTTVNCSAASSTPGAKGSFLGLTLDLTFLMYVGAEGLKPLYLVALVLLRTIVVHAGVSTFLFLHKGGVGAGTWPHLLQ